MGKWTFLFVYGLLVINLSKWGSSRLPITLFWFCNFLLWTLRKTLCYVCNRIVFHSNVTRTSKCWEKLTWNVTSCWVETSFSYIPFFPKGINCYKYSKCQLIFNLIVYNYTDFSFFFSPMRKIRLKWTATFSFCPLQQLPLPTDHKTALLCFISCSYYIHNVMSVMWCP